MCIYGGMILSGCTMAVEYMYYKDKPIEKEEEEYDPKYPPMPKKVIGAPIILTPWRQNQKPRPAPPRLGHVFLDKKK